MAPAVRGGRCGCSGCNPAEVEDIVAGVFRDGLTGSGPCGQAQAWLSHLLPATLPAYLSPLLGLLGLQQGGSGETCAWSGARSERQQAGEVHA